MLEEWPSASERRAIGMGLKLVGRILRNIKSTHSKDSEKNYLCRKRWSE
jgi:hypothetical protein